MVVVSYSGKEINAKLVYYGPGLCGKTTNLEHVYDSIPSTNRGKMVSMKTRTERTLFFDFLPVDLGEMGGFKTRFLLYTVPGQVYYNATRKLVLRGVDAVVFVADSARGKMNENLESLENLKENLREYGLDLATMPWVLQYNKRDLPETYSIEEMNQALNPNGNIPFFEAVATNGNGVFETLKGVSRLLLEKLSKEIKLSPRIADPGVDARRAAAPEARKSPAGVKPAAPGEAVGPMPAAPVAPAAASTPTLSAPATPVAAATSSAGAPAASRPSTQPRPTRAATPSPAEMSALAPTGEGKKDGFGSKLARMFGFGKRADAPGMPAAAMRPVEGSRSTDAPRPSEPPVAVSAPPRAAVVTSGTSTRISRLEPAPARPAAAAANGTDNGQSLEKRIRVPVSLELSADEIRSGARVRLVLDIDLSTMQATVESESRTGTR